jgi:hypothetical protein
MKLVTRTLLLLSCVAFAGCAQFRFEREASRYTRQLPAIDKVEIQKVTGNIEIEKFVEKIEATKTLIGNEAQAIATLWREQSYGGTGAICHSPAYAIKFYAKDHLILYASICYDCQNIGFIEPTFDRVLGFGGSGPKGQELLQIFKKAFPEAEANGKQ